MPASPSAIDRFTEPTRAWFTGAFDAPTAAQEGAWTAISSGEHALVVAPTGSGKTLAAFLWSLDRLASSQPEDEKKRCRVLYVSPLKALAVDVERNLRAPLAGIGQAAARLGLPRPEISVSTRSGDTPADERRAFARRPTDILITTPESLFLLLTSQAREALRGVETVIIDEVHAVCGSKRGAHLAVSLDRLDLLLDRPAQRIGLSATVRPIDEVSTFLAGGRPCRSSPRRRRRSGTSRSSSRSRTCPPWGSPPASSRGRRRGRSPGPPSGRPSRSGCSTSSRRTAPPSCSPTPAGWPSG